MASKKYIGVIGDMNPTTASASSFWYEQFKALDTVFGRKYDPRKVWGFNKVLQHYRAMGLSGLEAGTPAHWYQEYKSGNVDLHTAVRKLTAELPKAMDVLGWPEGDEVPVRRAKKTTETNNALKRRLMR
jgi:hypothetical protein